MLLLPSVIGPGSLSSVLRETVQALVDSSLDQKQIYGFIRSGEGNGLVTGKYPSSRANILYKSWRIPAFVTFSCIFVMD